MNTLKIAIYNDEGVGLIGYQSLLSSFVSKLQPFLSFSIQLYPINAQQIINNHLILENFDALIIGGGADLPYCKKLNGVGNQNIKNFIARGNLYIGICAGAYYGAKSIHFTGYDVKSSEKYKIVGERELGLFQGQAVGSIKEFTNNGYYDDSVNTKAIVQLSSNNQPLFQPFYYHGGCYFIPENNSEKDVLFYYPNLKENEFLPAVISGKYGKGRYLLSGVHFELCDKVYQTEIIDKITDGIEFKKEQSILNCLKKQNYGKVIYKEIAKLLDALNKGV
ncbi:BPL-N domain-containing protein [Phocoenobacter atlanticus]|uniref:BPL-N domain-containing protein n=1 Tax=Phocoenobacter atlanticus TaxID=3416742 RepID=UPI0027714A1C|nr:BPL-N domain-containing protein [Pasteurella atlantica]MDP8100867.1 BPL-N domain-containing protein [Pasteurella atlantica]